MSVIPACTFRNAQELMKFFAFLECYAVSGGKWLPTIRVSVVPPS